MFAGSVAELLEKVERDGRGMIEYRGRLFHADRSGLTARFTMEDGLEGVVTARWPSAPGSREGRATILRMLNSLVQRCGMFETCERAYNISYGKPKDDA